MSATHESFENVDDVTRDETGLAYAAAAVNRAEAQRNRDVELPSSLRAKLEADAEEFFATPPVVARIGVSPGMAFVAGALLSAAAFALVAAPFLNSKTRNPIANPGTPIVIDVDEETWAPLQPTATGDFAGVATGYERVTGELAWDENAQRGTMRFVGLPPNDPKAGQYQLWIVDPTRDDVPVDGGVFDITPDPDGVAVVEFEPRLPIGNATLFAVTYEQPGGVVVSDGPLLVTAAPKAS
ncbi:MAG: anti-sigma factor [Planctomycetota bacterium]